MPAVPDSYLHSVKNLSAMFEVLRSAGVPDRFTHEFLKKLGFTSSNDRAIIPVMKSLRFLDDNSAPTERYRNFRDPAVAGTVLAEALRDSYADLFKVNEKAQAMTATQLTGAFQRITGKGAAVSRKMATTFKTLADLADWKPSAAVIPKTKVEEQVEEKVDTPSSVPDETPPVREVGTLTLRHDVHVHLPITSDVKVYDAIFRSLREHFG